MLPVSEDKVYVDFFASHIKSYDSESFPIHFHEHIEIYFLVDGGKECLINNKVYEINAGDILIFKPNQIHKIIRDDNKKFERYIIEVSPRYLMDNFNPLEFRGIKNILNNNDVIIFSPTDEEKKKIIRLFSEYKKVNYQNPDPTFFHSTLRQIKFLELIACIFAILQNHKNSKHKSSASNSMTSPVLDYLDKNFTTANLDTLAEHFNLSKSYLCTMFKKNTLMTINSYITSKKIIYAKNLLAEGKNVTETTELCGFSDSTDFSRVFKKYTNTSPKKYQMSLKTWK